MTRLLSIFRSKGRFLWSQNKPRIFVLTLRTIFCDHFEKIILWHKKDVRFFFFLNITRLISTFRPKYVFLLISLKYRCLWSLCKPFYEHNSFNINISSKRSFFEITLKKIVFCPYLRNYQHSRKKTSFNRLFLPICPKISSFK